ncbi:MAG: acyl carrier protein [Egibacteraceae bacterium]
MTASGPPVTVDEVLELLIRRISGVMMVKETQLGAASRLDEDLHADSLDLVEIVEGVETDLRAHGVTVALPDAALVTLRTVGDAAERIAAHAELPASTPAAAQASLSIRGEERI